MSVGAAAMRPDAQHTHTHTHFPPLRGCRDRGRRRSRTESRNRRRERREVGPAHPRKTGPFSSSPMGGRRMAIMAVGGSDDECDMS